MEAPAQRRYQRPDRTALITSALTTAGVEKMGTHCVGRMGGTGVLVRVLLGRARRRWHRATGIRRASGTKQVVAWLFAGSSLPSYRLRGLPGLDRDSIDTGQSDDDKTDNGADEAKRLDHGAGWRQGGQPGASRADAG